MLHFILICRAAVLLQEIGQDGKPLRIFFHHWGKLRKKRVQILLIFPGKGQIQGDMNVVFSQGFDIAKHTGIIVGIAIYIGFDAVIILPCTVQRDLGIFQMPLLFRPLDQLRREKPGIGNDMAPERNAPFCQISGNAVNGLRIDQRFSAEPCERHFPIGMGFDIFGCLPRRFLRHRDGYVAVLKAVITAGVAGGGGKNDIAVLSAAKQPFFFAKKQDTELLTEFLLVKIFRDQDTMKEQSSSEFRVFLRLPAKLVHGKHAVNMKQCAGQRCKNKQTVIGFCRNNIGRQAKSRAVQIGKGTRKLGRQLRHFF